MKKLVFILSVLILPSFLQAATKTWVGGTNTAWSTGGNWSPTGVPTSSDSVIIPNSVTSNWPNITGAANCLKLRFVAGGTVYPRLYFSSSSSAVLNVYGDVVNRANKDVLELQDNCYIALRGSSSTNISNTITFKRLQVNKTSGAGVTVTSGTPEIAMFLLLTAGDLTLNSGTGLTLLSDVANKTAAYIDVVTGSPTGVINGSGAANVTVSQYINDWTNDPCTPVYPSDFNYRYFSSPITSTTWYTNFAKYPTNNLESDVEMIPWYASGNPSFYDPQTAYNRWYTPLAWAPNVGIPGFYWYDETLEDPDNTTPGDNGWYGYQGWTTSKTFSNRLLGYLVHSKITQADRTVKWKGTVNNAPSGSPITGTFHNTNYGETSDGLNLAGNPFPSGLDWTAVWSDGDNTNFNSTISIWRNCGSISNDGWNVDFNADDPSSTPDFDGILAIGQGFFIRSTVDDNVLTMKNDHRVGGVQPIHWRKNVANQPNGFGIKLQGTGNPDQIYFRYADEYSVPFNPAKDVAKVSNPKQSNSMYSRKDGHKVSIQYFKTPSQKTEIPVELSLVNKGTYTLSSFNVSDQSSGYRSYLLDKQNNTLIDISSDMKYTFESDAGEIKNRFAVVTAQDEIESETLLNSLPLDMALSWAGNELKIWPINTTAKEGTLSVSDLSGKELLTEKIGLNHLGSSVHASQLKPGIYLVKLNANGKSATRKLLI